MGTRNNGKGVCTTEPGALLLTPPERVIRYVSSASGKPSVARYAGVGGCRVVTYRLTNREGQEVKRERLSDDSYPSMPNIVSFAEPD